MNGLAVPFGMMFGGVVDPLAGLTFLFKGLPLSGNVFSDSAATTEAVVDGQVRAWRDENGVAYTRPSGGEPKLKIVSGSPVLRFESANNEFLTRSVFSIAGDYTLFMKQQTSGDCILVGQTSNSNQLLRIGFPSDSQLFVNSGTGATGSSSTLTTPRTSPSVIGVIRSGSTVTFYEGASARGTATVTGDFNTDQIGGTINAGIINGDIWGLLLADTDMTANVPEIVAALDAL